jgi:hypothetical protein
MPPGGWTTPITTTYISSTLNYALLSRCFKSIKQRIECGITARVGVMLKGILA